MAEKKVRRRSRKKRKRRTKAYFARILALIVILAALLLLIFGAFKAIKVAIGFFSSGDDSEEAVNSSSNIISVDSDGSLTETSVEDFDTDVYDPDELQKMIDETIGEYNGKGEERIVLKSLDIKGGKARAVIWYKAAEDYAAYNEKVMETGDVSDLDITGVTLADDKNTVLTHDAVEKVKGRYILLNDDTTVAVPKKILYISRNVTKTGKKQADVKKAGIDSVIIYK